MICHGPGSRTAEATTAPPGPSTCTSRELVRANVDHDLGRRGATVASVSGGPITVVSALLRRVGLGERGVEESGEQVGPHRPGRIRCGAAKAVEQRPREVPAIVGLVGRLAEIRGEGDERLLRERVRLGARFVRRRSLRYVGHQRAAAIAEEDDLAEVAAALQP